LKWVEKLTIYEWLQIHGAIRGVIYLCDLTQSTAFFAEINDNPTASLLCLRSECQLLAVRNLRIGRIGYLFHGLLDSVDEIGTTRADVRSEHVTSITL
jgi:hypothetical protein